METTTPTTHGAMRAVVIVTIVGAAGSLLMAIAHAGVHVPLFSALGPEGDAVVPQAAAGFGVGALLYAVTAIGLVQRRSWSWAVGLVVNALVLLSAAFPYRGIGSVAGIAVSAAGLALLLSPPVRRSLIPR